MKHLKINMNLQRTLLFMHCALCLTMDSIMAFLKNFKKRKKILAIQWAIKWAANVPERPTNEKS